MYLCTLNTESKLDNMSNTHNIISKAQKVTYTQKQHSKNHTSPPLWYILTLQHSGIYDHQSQGLLCTCTYLLSSVNIRKADKLCLMNLSSSAFYSLLPIACITTVYTKTRVSSSPCETKDEHDDRMNRDNVKDFL